MKKVLKTTLITCIIVAMAASSTASVSAACPLTSLFSGGLSGVLQGATGGQSCGSGLLQSILASKGCGTGSLNCTDGCTNGNVAGTSTSDKASITLSKSSVTMKANTTQTIKASVKNVKELTATSSNSCVKATVTAVSGDKATITLTGTCGGIATVKICSKDQSNVCKTVSVVVSGTSCAAGTDCEKTETNSNTSDSESTQATTYAEEVLKYVNEARVANGLSSLKLNSTLSKAAGIRVNEIKKSFSHTRPDGRSCFTVFAEAGYTYRAAGENIARGYSSAKSVVNAWLASPGHRANILSSKYTYMGLAKDGTYWAQLFAA